MGIGTTSPSYKLVASSGTSGTSIASDFSSGIATGTEYSALKFTASAYGYIGSEIRGINTNGGVNLGVMAFYTSGSERMRIDASGQVMLGTTTPVATGSGSLTVGATTASSSTTSGALQVAGGVGIAGALHAGGAVNFGEVSSSYGSINSSYAGVTTTSATIICNNLVNTTAALMFIYGDNGNNGWMDLLMVMPQGPVITVSSGTAYGSPPTRSYSTSGTNNLYVTLSSGGYNVRSVSVQPYYR